MEATRGIKRRQRYVVGEGLTDRGKKTGPSAETTYSNPLWIQYTVKKSTDEMDSWLVSCKIGLEAEKLLDGMSDSSEGKIHRYLNPGS